MDSCYTNRSVLNACWKKGYLISAMKTNRILFQGGKCTSAAGLAISLDSDCFYPVTVKGRTYMVYRYEEPLNKFDHSVVLLSCPAGAMGQKCVPRVFLCSTSTLSAQTILVRATKALDRLLFAYFFFSCALGHIVPFHIGLHLCWTTFAILEFAHL